MDAAITHLSSCSDYLKDKYKSLTDRSHVDKGYCKSRAYKVDLGASVIDLLPFLGKGSYSDDLKTCEELATSNLISNSNQFKEAQSGVSNAAYFYCSSQQGGKIDADESQMVKKIASSAVVDAYNKCLDANKQGLQTAVTYPSSDRTSVVVTIKFVYQFSGKGAEISGYSVKPDGKVLNKIACRYPLCIISQDIIILLAAYEKKNHYRVSFRVLYTCLLFDASYHVDHDTGIAVRV